MPICRSASGVALGGRGLLLADHVAHEHAHEDDGSDIAGHAVNEVYEITQTEVVRGDHAEHGERYYADTVFERLLVGSDLAAEAPHHRAGGGVDGEDYHDDEDALSHGSEQAGERQVGDLGPRLLCRGCRRWQRR